MAYHTGSDVMQDIHGSRSLIQCSSCGMTGKVRHTIPMKFMGKILLEKHKMDEEPEFYIYPGPDDQRSIVSKETLNKMASQDFIWSKASYSVTSLMAKYSAKFPIIVMVTNGYYGKYDIDTLASCQVARLHTWGLQERVIARDSRGRQLSIPKNYQIEFEVIDKKKNKKSKKSKPKRLQDIINSYDLPVTVQFSKKTRWHFRIGSQRYYTRDFGPLEINRVYQERFLKGNTIHNGIIDTKVMLLPMYVRVKFKVATGIKGQTAEEWQALQDMYTKVVSHIAFDKIQGTKDMTEYLAKIEQPDSENLTEDELDTDDGLSGKDANANYTSVEDKEQKHSKPNGDIKKTNVMHSQTHVLQNGVINSEDNENDPMMKIPMSGKLLMQVTKDDLERASEHVRSEPDIRSTMRSDMSDISSISGVQNVVRVSLTNDADMVTQEVFDRDRLAYGRPRLYSSGPPSSIHGSTIINVTNNEYETEIIQPQSWFNTQNTFSYSDNNLRRTFSDMDMNDNSVFLHSSQPYINEVPNYATARRYKTSYPSVSSNDISRFPRHIRDIRGKYGQRLLGGAPLVEDRRYHSMKDLSRIDQSDSGISRAQSFRSAIMSPSPGPPRRQKKPNLYLRISDDDEISHHSTHNYNSNNVAYVRRAGIDRANKVALHATPHRPKERERHYNQGVYFTDGFQNYTLPTKRNAPRPPPPSYDSLDYVELIEEDYTHSDPSLWNPPQQPRHRSNQQQMQSPGQSSSSNEDSKRYFIMYDNGAGNREVKEVMENGDEYLYQGSMTLRKNDDMEGMSTGNGSVIDIPVTDVRTKARAGQGWSLTMNDDIDIPVHNMRANNVIERTEIQRTETRPVETVHRTERTEYITENHAPTKAASQSARTEMRVTQQGYDEIDTGLDAVNASYVDMTKGAAEHWGRVMDADTSYTRHRVPIELEGRSGINESMFEGGHHSFTVDRNVCARMDRHRMERSQSHRDNLRRMGIHPRQQREERTTYNKAVGVDTRLPERRVGYAANLAKQKAERYSTSYSLRSNTNEVIETDNDLLAARPLFTNERVTNTLLDSAPEVGIVRRSTIETEALKVEKSPSVSTYSGSSASSQSGELVIQGSDDGEHGQGSYDLAAAEVSAAQDSKKEVGAREQSHHFETSYTIQNIPIEVEGKTAARNSGHIVENHVKRESHEHHHHHHHDRNHDLSALDNYEGSKENKLHIQGNERISRKKAREMTRTGSVRSLREVYARSRSPSTSERDAPAMAVAPATEVFTDILNKPNSTGTDGSTNVKTKNTTTTTTTERNVVMRNKQKPADLTTQRYGQSSSTSKLYDPATGKEGEELSWQDTQSFHLESIRDSIRDLDEYLKNQGGDTDTHSQSSAASSKHMEHFSYALTNEATTF